MWMLHLSVWNWNGFCNKISSVIRPNPSETHSTIQFETIENSLCPFHLIIIRWKGTEKSCLFNDQRVPLWKLQFRPSYNTHPQPSCVFVVVSLKIISSFETDRSFNYGLCSTGSVWSDSFSTGAQFLRRACSRSNCPKCGKCSDCHLGTPLRLPGCRIARLSGCQVTFFPLSDKTLLLIWTDFWSHALLCHIWPKPHCFIGLFDLFTVSCILYGINLVSCIERQKSNECSLMTFSVYFAAIKSNQREVHRTCYISNTIWQKVQNSIPQPHQPLYWIPEKLLRMFFFRENGTFVKSWSKTTMIISHLES